MHLSCTPYIFICFFSIFIPFALHTRAAQTLILNCQRQLAAFRRKSKQKELPFSTFPALLIFYSYFLLAFVTTKATKTFAHVSDFLRSDTSRDGSFLFLSRTEFNRLFNFSSPLSVLPSCIRTKKTAKRYANVPLSLYVNVAPS